MQVLRQNNRSVVAKALLLVGVLGLLVLFMTMFSSGLLNPASEPQGSQQQSMNYGTTGGYASPGQPVVNEVAKSEDGLFTDASSSIVLDGEVASQERVILKTAYLSLVVDAADENIAAISALAEEMGGWVVSSNTNMVTAPSGQSVARGSVNIRVPAARLDEALNTIKSGAGSVESESVTGQDVTQQYVDLKSRLTNLEAAETQLREILASANKTEDVLAVYNQLVSTRGEIETVRGQIQYFDESASFSSITVDLTPKAINIPVQIAGWSPGRTVERALAGLINALQFLVDFVIVAVVQLLPLVVIIALPLWFLWRRFRPRKTA